MQELYSLIEKLNTTHSLSEEEYVRLIDGRTPQLAEMLAQRAVAVRKSIYGNDVYIRGLIEISNICRNDCLYCGIRKSNRSCTRYRLTPEQILSSADAGYELGFRTFMMQGGEDGFFTDEVLVPLIRELKRRYPDVAVTLSLGERSAESYRTLFNAGADRYLLRHETADPKHYAKLHPAKLSWQHRMDCLQTLKDIGYQVGAGFMVGSPYQTTAHLAKDLKFIEIFKPDMCGIGPFIPHHETPFADRPAGTVELTCYLLSIIRLIHPPVLLPATTALGTIAPRGREQGILSGANVIMPNLSPEDNRKNYELYDNKLVTGLESAEKVLELKEDMRSIGYEIVCARGDVRTQT